MRRVRRRAADRRLHHQPGARPAVRGGVRERASTRWWDEAGRPDPYVVVEAGAGRDDPAPRDHGRRPGSRSTTSASMFADRLARTRRMSSSPTNCSTTSCSRSPSASTANGSNCSSMTDAFVLGPPVALDLDAPDGSRVPWHTAAVDWIDRAKRTAPAPLPYRLRHRHHRRTRRACAVAAHLPRPRPRERPVAQARRPGHHHRHRIRPARTRPAEHPGRLAARPRHRRFRRAGQGHVARTRHLGDLEAMKARARVNEADALLDPDGPGGFLVAEWLP